MSTALDLIKAAMRKGGILTKTESPTADEAADALQTLNDILDGWANDSLTVPYRTNESFTLTGGTASYTIGTGATFNTAKPIAIIKGTVNDGSVDEDLFPISEEEYASFALKTTQATPEYFAYNNGHPTGIIKFYPTPSSSYSITLLTEKMLTSLTLAQTVDLPAGWKRAIIYTLAQEIAPEYGVQLSPEVAVIANDAKAGIKLAIARNRSMDAHLGGGGFNINRGWVE